MSSRTFLLTFSLGANALILAAFALRPAATATFFSEVFHRGSSVNGAARETGASVAVAAPAQAPQAPGAKPLVWTEIAPDDFTGLVARLRAAGFPGSLVQAVVTAVVGESYNARRAALRPANDRAVYWKNPTYDPAVDAEARRALDREQRKLLRELLGADLYAADDALHPERRRQQFGELPAEKVALLRKIFSDYDELTDEAYAENPSRVTPEGRAKRALLEKEKRADIERALSAEELLYYDLLDSQAARALRNRFGKFEPTEAEFKSVYPLQKIAADIAAGLTRPFPPEQVRLRRQAEQQVDAEIRRVLGETRYAEFQLANDSVVQRAAAFVARNNLPPAVVAPFAAIQREVSARLGAIEGNRDLTPNQRENQLSAAATEAKKKIGDLLGPAGLEAYLTRAGGGAYLNDRIRAAPPAP